MRPAAHLPQRASLAIAAGLALLLGLGGCASRPGAGTPTLAQAKAPALADLPGHWQQAAKPAASLASSPVTNATPTTAAGTVAALPAEVQAFAAFNDPLLRQLVQQALAANTDLALAQANLAQARALRDQQAAAQGLQVNVGASAGRQRSSGQTGNSLKTALDASWEADLFGALAQAENAAAAQVRASAATLDATRQAVAANTAIAYLQWQGTRAQQVLAQAAVVSRQQSLQLVQWRQQAGLASSLDEAQARTSLQQAQAQVPALDSTLQQTAHQLAVLLGQAPGSLQARLMASPTRQPAWGAQATPLVLPAEVLRRRPDVVAAEEKLAAQLATLAQRQAEGRPSFQLSGSLGLQAASWAALGGPAAVLAGLTATVSAPLLDGGANAAQVAAQQAVLQQAQASYRATVLQALQDVMDALASLQALADQTTALDAADSNAQQALALARHRYSSGLIDFATLLDTERSALNTADAAASARTQQATAQVRLLKGLGGSAANENTP